MIKVRVRTWVMVNKGKGESEVKNRGVGGMGEVKG